MAKMKANSLNGSVLGLALILILGACGSTAETTSDNSNEGSDDLPADYPDSSIDALVGYAPGGGQDLMMRTTGEILNDEGIMEQPFVVENQPGAGGRLASEEVINRSDDPHLLQVVPEYGAGWDPRQDMEFSDFNPIAAIATSDLYIVVEQDSPYETVDELFEALQSNEEMTISTLGPVDGGEAFIWDEIRQLADIDELNYVPMEGASESFTAVLSGQVDVTLAVLPVIQDYIETDEIRALAVLSDERTEDLPDVPTLQESGFDFSYSRFTGIWTGGDVSDEVVEYWEENIREMTETDAWEEFLANNGLSPYYQGTEEYIESIEEAGARFNEYIESLEE